MIKRAGLMASLRRAASLLAAVAILLPATWAAAAVTHGVVTMDAVNLRPSINTSDYIDRLNAGWVAQVLEVVTDAGKQWYRVKTNTPTFPNRTYEGYIAGAYFRMMTEAEEAAWLKNPNQGGVIVTPAPIPGTTVPYVGVLVAGANLRQTPGGISITALPLNAVANVLEVPTDKVSGWYKVTYGGFTGYLQASQVKELTAAEAAAWAAGATPLPPSVPGAIGYVRITRGDTNLRVTPDGSVLGILNNGDVLPYFAMPVRVGIYDWVYVREPVKNQMGYVRSDCYQIISGTPGTVTPLPQPTANPTQQNGYVQITKPGTNLRQQPGGTSLKQLSAKLVLPYFGQPVYQMGYSWAYVRDAAGAYGYVRSDCYRLTDATGNPVTAAPVATATPPPPAAGISGYVRIRLQGTNLRRSPGGETLGQLDRGLILPYYGSPLPQGGYQWVNVFASVRNAYGYVRSDCYEFVTSDGKPATAPPAGTPAPLPGYPTVPPQAAGGYIKLIKGGVNLRQTAGGKTIASLARDTVMPYYGFTQSGGYGWYYVLSPQGAGYIRSDMAIVTDANGGVVQPSPLPTAAPGTTTGYVVTTLTGVNLRRYARTDAEVLKVVGKQVVLPIVGMSLQGEGYYWFNVRAESLVGYIRSDCARQLTAQEVTDYLAGKLPPVTPLPSPGGDPTGAIGHLITIMSSVNIRMSPSLDAKVLSQTGNKGVVLPYFSAITSSGRLWYRISFASQTAYILGSTVRIMTPEEYAKYIGSQPTVPPVVPTTVPRPEDMSNVALTTLDKVLIRTAASMSAKYSILYRRGEVCKLLGPTATAEGYNWYQVMAAGITGWVRADLLRILTKAEAAALEQTGDPNAPKEATYTTLQKGSSGPEVTRLQTELSRLGFLPAAGVTGNYTSDTVDAVMKFQTSAGLPVDGIAGSATQHKLYGTVPPGSGTVTPGIANVELVDWNSGVIQQAWAAGVTATITDVYTGISFRARRWAGGSHIDAEPLTSTDTAAMCRIYGVRSAQEILDKNLYQRRPLWVSVGGRVFAASLYGVPHNYPDGDTIPDNEFSGQFCVHFLNSRIHSSGTVDPSHQAAVKYAYDHAPSRK